MVLTGSVTTKGDSFFVDVLIIHFPQIKLQSVSGALYKPNLCIKNIHFCDHKGYIEVKRHFIFEVHVFRNSTLVFTEHRNIKQRSLAFTQRE